VARTLMSASSLPAKPEGGCSAFRAAQFFIEDNGVAQSHKHLLRKLQTSVRRDLERLKADSGSGKLCSWPILSAGSKLIISFAVFGRGLYHSIFIGR